MPRAPAVRQSKPPAHTVEVNTSNTTGYSLYLAGTTLEKTGGGYNINAAYDGTSHQGYILSAGIENFGVRLTNSTAGTVDSPYNSVSKYALNPDGLNNGEQIGHYGQPISSDVYNIYYGLAVSNYTTPGNYHTDLIYTVLPNP